MTDAQRLDLLRPLDTLGTITPLGPIHPSNLPSQPIRRLPASKP